MSDSSQAVGAPLERHVRPRAWLVMAHGCVQKIVVRADVADELACKWRETDPRADALPLYDQIGLNEAAQVAANTERHACSIAVWMTKMDATADDADDKGVAGWLDEAEQRVKRRSVKAPCGECHLQPGERCDVCGASSGA